jgi:outer membrane protein OmpA-like peptidoglycan-associated protein
MNRRLLLIVVTLLALPPISSSKTWEEFPKTESSDTNLGIISKAGPKIIPKDVIIEGLRKDCEVTFTSEAVLFRYGSAKIKEESMPNVQNIASAIKQAMEDPELSKIKTYYVEGHTCNIGSAERNCRLSWMRAQAMIEELAKLGVPLDKLEPRGFGMAYPAQANDTEANRVMNRRVVLQGDCARGTAADTRTPCEQKPPTGSAGTGDTVRRPPPSSETESTPVTDPPAAPELERDSPEPTDSTQ